MSFASDRRSRILFLTLLIVGGVFLLTLPWQRHQWTKTQQIQQENTVQEARLREVQAQQSEVHQATDLLKTASPQEISVRLDAAHTLLVQGNTAEAGRTLVEIEKTAFPDGSAVQNATLTSTLTGLFQEAGWIDRALVNARRTLEATPNNLEAILRLAVIEAQLGWQKECRAHVETALRLAPQSAEPHLALALLDDQIGALKGAESQLLEADRARPGDLSISLLLFRNRMQQRNYDRALEPIEKLVAFSPADVSLLGAQAEAIVERALNRPGGEKNAELQRGLEVTLRYQQLAPANADAQLLLGKIYGGLGDEAAALTQWEAAYTKKPLTPALASRLGQLLVRRGQVERGRQIIAEGDAIRSTATEYNRLLTLAGTNRTADPEKHRQLARWCRSHAKLSRAILEWEQVLSLVPKDKEAKREYEVCWAKRWQSGLS